MSWVAITTDKSAEEYQRIKHALTAAGINSVYDSAGKYDRMICVPTNQAETARKVLDTLATVEEEEETRSPSQLPIPPVDYSARYFKRGAILVFLAFIIVFLSRGPEITWKTIIGLVTAAFGLFWLFMSKLQTWTERRFRKKHR